MTPEPIRVVILRDAPAEGVWEGDVGTIVREFPEREEFEVEFRSSDGVDIVLTLHESELTTPGARRLGKALVMLAVLIPVGFWLSLPIWLPSNTVWQIQGVVYLLPVALALGATLLWVLLTALDTLRRTRGARTNPTPVELRPLVLSDLSWDNCAMAPDFCTGALSAFRFLVEEEGFEPARVDREWKRLAFRRGDVEVRILEHMEADIVIPFVQIVLYRSPTSHRLLAEKTLGGEAHALGDGYRGAAFHLQTRLDSIIATLRGQPSFSELGYLLPPSPR